MKTEVGTCLHCSAKPATKISCETYAQNMAHQNGTHSHCSRSIARDLDILHAMIAWIWLHRCKPSLIVGTHLKCLRCWREIPKMLFLYKNENTKMKKKWPFFSKIHRCGLCMSRSLACHFWSSRLWHFMYKSIIQGQSFWWVYSPCKTTGLQLQHLQQASVQFTKLSL